MTRRGRGCAAAVTGNSITGMISGSNGPGDSDTLVGSPSRRPCRSLAALAPAGRVTRPGSGRRLSIWGPKLKPLLSTSFSDPLMRLESLSLAIAVGVCVAGAVTAHPSEAKSIAKLPAFVSGGALRLKAGRGVLGLSACAQNQHPDVNRRAVLASVALGLTGLLPTISRAQPLSASEAEEYARLLEQVIKNKDYL